jgi:hypothetical protein
MSSKLFDQYSKKYQQKIIDQVEALRSLEDEDPFTLDFVVNDIHNLFQLMPEVREKFSKTDDGGVVIKDIQSMLGTWMSSIEMKMENYIFYERIFNDNLEVYLNGLYTLQRLRFIDLLTKPIREVHSEAIIDLRHSMAYLDEQLINIYRENFSGQFEHGHPFNISLGNGIDYLLNEELEKCWNYIDERLKLKTLGKYDKAVLNNIKSIAKRDERTFTTTLDYMLGNHYKLMTSILGRFLGIEVLGYYNLAKYIWNQDPPQLDNSLWDSYYIDYSKNNTPELVMDFTQFSDVLNEWLIKLPPEYDVNVLIDSYKG